MASQSHHCSRCSPAVPVPSNSPETGVLARRLGVSGSGLPAPFLSVRFGLSSPRERVQVPQAPAVAAHLAHRRGDSGMLSAGPRGWTAVLCSPVDWYLSLDLSFSVCLGFLSHECFSLFIPRTPRFLRPGRWTLCSGHSSPRSFLLRRSAFCLTISPGKRVFFVN